MPTMPTAVALLVVSSELNYRYGHSQTVWQYGCTIIVQFHRAAFVVPPSRAGLFRWEVVRSNFNGPGGGVACE